MPRRTEDELTEQRLFAFELFARGRSPAVTARALEERYGLRAVSRRTVERWYAAWRSTADPDDFEPWDPLDGDPDDGCVALAAFQAVLSDRGAAEEPALCVGMVRRVAQLKRVCPQLPGVLAYDLALLSLNFTDDELEALLGEPFGQALARFLVYAPWFEPAAADAYRRACLAAGARRALAASRGLGTHGPRLVLEPLG